MMSATVCCIHVQYMTYVHAEMCIHCSICILTLHKNIECPIGVFLLSERVGSPIGFCIRCGHESILYLITMVNAYMIFMDVFQIGCVQYMYLWNDHFMVSMVLYTYSKIATFRMKN